MTRRVARRCCAVAGGARRRLRHARRRHAPTTARRPTQATTNSAKPDIAKAGDVTLTVWDQEVRGGQNDADQAAQRGSSMAKYPNVKIKRVAKSFDDLQHDAQARGLGPERAGRRARPTRAAGSWASSSRPGCSRPLDDYAKVYGWNDRYSTTLLDLNTFSADGKQFGSGDLYGLSQMGEIVGVFYNKDKVPTPPKTLDEFEAIAAGGQGRRARRRSCSATSTSGRASTSSRPCSGQTADKQAIRDFVFAKDGASLRHAGVHRRRRRRSRSGSTRATSTRTSTAPATTRRGSSSPRARARS